MKLTHRKHSSSHSGNFKKKRIHRATRPNSKKPRRSCLCRTVENNSFAAHGRDAGATCVRSVAAGEVRIITAIPFEVDDKKRRRWQFIPEAASDGQARLRILEPQMK